MNSFNEEKSDKYKRIHVRRQRKKQLEEHLECRDFHSGPIICMPIIIESGHGDYQFGVERVRKNVCSRSEFEEMYRVFTDYEYFYEGSWFILDILAMIDVHVSVRVSNEQRQRRTWEEAPLDPRSIENACLREHTAKEVASLVCKCLFWGDEALRNFAVNFRDSNEKYISAESDEYFYSIWMGCS